MTFVGPDLPVYGRRQAGQSMVLAIIFGAVLVIGLLVLFNQSQLVRAKTQIENANDAAVYSIAKLDARQKNLTSYLNRSMVANEVLLGQFSGVLSVLNKYGSMAFYPATYLPYQFPIAPPSPVTAGQAMASAAAPISAAANGVAVPLSQALSTAGTAVSNFNKLLGLFEHVFAGATIVSQFTKVDDIVKAHATPLQRREGRAPDVANLGYFFVAMNTMQTYFGDRINWGVLEAAYQAAQFSPALSESQRAHYREYLERNSDVIANSLLRLNSYTVRRGQYGDAGDSNSRDGDVLRGEQQRFAAISNSYGGPFTESRGGRNGQFTFDIGGEFNPLRFGGIPGGVLPAGAFGITAVARFGINIEASVGSDGGSSLRYTNRPRSERQYAWSSADLFYGDLKVGPSREEGRNNEVCFSFRLPVDIGLPSLGERCVSLDVFTDIAFAAVQVGLEAVTPAPYGGGAHQFASVQGVTQPRFRQFKFARESAIGDWRGGQYGELTGEDANRFVLPLSHMNSPTAGVGGQGPFTGGTSPYVTLATPRGGGLRDATSIPTFWSVNPALRHQNRAPAYALVVMQDGDNILTSDNLRDGARMGSKAGEQSIKWMDTSLETKSYSDAELEALNEVVDVEVTSLIGGNRPMVSLSSAEIYHERLGEDETANLFSPFWDARLTENSPLHSVIVRGLQNPQNFIDGLNLEAPDMLRAAFEYTQDVIVEESEQLLEDLTLADVLPGDPGGAIRSRILRPLENFEP